MGKVKVFYDGKEAIFTHLTRKKYIEAMNETQYGSKPQGMFSHVNCPSDLEFIGEEELLDKKCVMSCKECWKYVLKNKKW